jgi:hypothetical protein
MNYTGALFENLDSFHNPVLGTIIIAESQYQSVMAQSIKKLLLWDVSLIY